MSARTDRTDRRRSGGVRSTQVTLVAHFTDGRSRTDFVTDPLETPAGVFFGLDLLAVAVVGLAFMLAEARRIGLRHVWIYVALTFLVAISVSFPLFLIARQRQLGKVELDVRGTVRA